MSVEIRAVFNRLPNFDLEADIQRISYVLLRIHFHRGKVFLSQLNRINSSEKITT